jgi:copper oxidase (laccase) domain-containing protein
LSSLGLASVEGLGVDTCAEPERFYSYRRCILNGEKCYGRLLSAIMLKD